MHPECGSSFGSCVRRVTSTIQTFLSLLHLSFTHSIININMADALLERVEPLTHPARVTALWKYGRDTPSDQIAAIITDFESRDGYYEHRIAATLAAASGDTGWAAAHLADPNPSVRRKALQLASQLPDAAIKAALDDAPAAVRFDLYRTLKGRTALADELVETVRNEWGDEEAARILHWCSTEAVHRLLPTFLLALARNGHWRQLASSHPQALLTALSADLDQSVQDGIQVASWWDRYDTALGALVKHANISTEILDLLARCRAQWNKAWGGLPSALTTYLDIHSRLSPRATLQLLADRAFSPGGLPPGVSWSGRRWRRLAGSGLPEVETWIKSCPSNRQKYQILQLMPPSHRVKMYELDPTRPLPADALELSGLRDALPTFYLATLAREALPALKEDSWRKRLPALAQLPPTEVADEFLEGTRRSDPDERSEAWKWYIANARAYGAAALAAAVGHMATRFRNEQQPVRASAIYALGNVPARLWNLNALASLKTVLKDAMEARDRAGECSSLNSLPHEILVSHPDSPGHVQWAVECIRLFARIIPRYVPDMTLRKGQEEIIWEAYKPFIDTESKRNKHETLLSLADRLGNNAANLPELQDMLWLLITSGEELEDYTAQRAIRLWLQPKVQRSERVAKVIALDPSAVTMQEVSDILATKRTDLLGPALVSRPSGRFWKSGSAWVLPAPLRSPQRWTPRQTAAYLSQLRNYVSDPEVTMWETGNALKGLKHVPGGSELARSWVQEGEAELQSRQQSAKQEAEDQEVVEAGDGSDDEDWDEDSQNESPVTLVESSLEALVTSPADLEFLYSFASSDRARVAIYTASGAARRERPSILEPLLLDVLGRIDVKITSKKEVVRQATSLLPLAVSRPLLQRLANAADLHKDVRAALVAAATRNLSSKAAWNMIENAIKTEESSIAEVICHVLPFDVPREKRSQYAAFIAQLAMNIETYAVKMVALNGLATWASFNSKAGESLITVVTDMSVAASIWQTAADSLITWADEESILSALSRLIVHQDDPNDVDMPALGRISHLTSALQSTAWRHRPLARAVSAHLCSYPDHIPSAARLRVAALDYDNLADDVRSIANLIEGRPVLAHELRGILSFHLGWTEYGEEGADWTWVWEFINGGVEEGMLALGIVEYWLKKAPEDEEWKGKLAALRAHASADVRDWAKRVRAPAKRGVRM